MVLRVWLVLSGVAMLVAAWLAAPPMVAAEEPDDPVLDEQAAEVPTTNGVAYQVKLLGVEDDDLRDVMERSLNLKTLADRPPATLSGLLRRIEGDEERLRVVLRSEGFWDGKVQSAFEETTEPPTVVLTVEPGARYSFGSFTVRFAGDRPPPEAPDPEAVGFVAGQPARGAEVVEVGNRLLQHLENNARPLARQVDRVITVDHRDQTVNVTWVMDPGPPARFGALTLEGLQRTHEDYLRQWVTWREGEPFDLSQVDAFTRNLRDTGLFSSVILALADTVDADGQLAITVKLTESKPRTVGAGISYSTDGGPGGRVFWRHRNLFGRDENLDIGLGGDFLEQSFVAAFQRPNFHALDRELFARASFTNSNTDAFTGIEAATTVGIGWPLTDKWDATVAGGLEYSRLEDTEGTQDTLLFGLPSTLSYSGHDNDLDPTEGVRFNLALTPYAGASDVGLTFVHSEADLAVYQPLDSDRRYVLAGRLRIGSIFGEETANIPANKRFYAGGGGSIRGYGFQLVGPLDADNDPIGGRSLFLVAAEARLRVWGNIAVVPFINGGNVYDNQLPNFDEPLQWAAGLGLRYHSPAGPLRLDVGFPINRRPGIDDAFQFYISLGQAF